MRERIELVFLGVFEPASFSEFMGHRARRLSVDAETHRLDAGRVEVTVEGESALVDMFEVACSLGPLDCLVTDVSRRAA
jgi:acylphosphatase